MRTTIGAATITLAAALAVAGCKGGPGEGGAILAIDGSSTVYPVTEAVAEAYGEKNAEARVTIGVSGTGGGFKKFCTGETAISNASRPIKPSEVELCGEHGVEYIELPIAYDGIAIVVNPKADHVDDVTVDELKTIWEPAAQREVTKWSDVREDWPDEALHLFGPGVDSGTYDYFTKAVVGVEHASRGDYTSSEDDNVLVQGISTDERALGFFGYAYYEENQDKLKLLGVDDGDPSNGEGPVKPSPETIADGTYQPLSRPVFVYVSKEAAARPEVQGFVDFYLTEAADLVREVGYVPLPEKTYGLAKERFDGRVTGSVFEGEGSKVGVTVEKLLSGEAE
ncbi:MAG: PstS family phosphate ABC transporter substrate-binding protein [Myxococcota bacterium]